MADASFDPLVAISPLDGRYSQKVLDLGSYFSEAALMKYRLRVEVEWLIYFANHIQKKRLLKLNPKQQKDLRRIVLNFGIAQAKKVKNIEQTTNHDVKAVEYFLKETLQGMKLQALEEFVHFGCTSEDINNLSIALMVKEAIEDILLPEMKELRDQLHGLALKHAKVSMLSRTHGQPASPTTLGKELINFVARFDEIFSSLKKFKYYGKFNGAVGCFNAHLVAYPDVDWPHVSSEFIKSLGLVPHLYTTQIEPHDFLATLFSLYRHFNTILIGLNRDMWSYISVGYFKQKLKSGEIGSSTMPHKVNPIDFENSEGNLGMANALFDFFSQKLPISRLQRDLTDSTVQRNIGIAFAYSFLAYKSCTAGLGKLELDQARMKEDLENNWEVLAEAIQTIMRKYQLEKPYEKLKELTRGKKVDQKVMEEFIDTLEIPSSEKKALKSLTPSNYSGLAEKLVQKYKPLL